MSDHVRSTQAMKREVSATGGDALWRTLYHLWPYIWPTDRRDLKQRVLLSFALLIAAKLATIAVPFTFKWATDALVEAPEKAGGSSFLAWALAVLSLVGVAAATGVVFAVASGLKGEGQARTALTDATGVREIVREKYAAAAQSLSRPASAARDRSTGSRTRRARWAPRNCRRRR